MNYWFLFQSDQLLLLQKNNHYSLPAETQLIDPLKPYLLHYHLLGEFNHITCYCAAMDMATPLPVDSHLIPLKKAFEYLDTDWHKVAVKAYSAINWDKNHQFCGRCGNYTTHTTGTFERICSVCQLALYPRISPSIIVLIQKGPEVLMARSAHFSPGVYGLIAGFVEIGESVEDAIHREVQEEVSIKIKNLRYYCSQPWPFPDSLMLGFFADYASGEIQIDKKEIESAAWYHYDNLPSRSPSNISISKKLIDHFVKQQRQLL